MKKSILLTVILSLKLIVSSALGTDIIIDTNIAPVPVTVGRLIVKDIVKGDSAISELKIYQTRDSLWSIMSLKKDSTISVLTDQVSTYRSLYETEKLKGSFKDTIISQKTLQVDMYKKEAKKQKGAKIASQGLLGFGIAALVVLAFVF